MTTEPKLDPAKKTDTKPTEKNVDEESQSDREMRENLEMLVARIAEKNEALHVAAVEMLRSAMRSATSSMTAVPLPLKLLRPHFKTLKKAHSEWPQASAAAQLLADALSALAMADEDGGVLKYRLAAETKDTGSKGSTEIAYWGHEYVRCLAADIIAQWPLLTEDRERTLALALQVAAFSLAHNAEADACDLLIELEALDHLPALTDKVSYSRVCFYILGCAPYVTPPDDLKIYNTAHAIYTTYHQYPSALQVALKLNNHEMIANDFNTCPDPIIQKQLAFILARQQVTVDTDDEQLKDILGNSHLSQHYMALGRDLGVAEPKLPEDIYKRHLENVRPGFATVNLDSAKQNLASTFVNAFINAGFGTDKLMMGPEDTNWIYKNKDHGMMSAAASLGAIMLWDVEGGLAHIDKYLYSQEDNIQAGALLAIGIVSATVRNESDPALALLSEKVNSDKAVLRIAAIVGYLVTNTRLGIAYAGSPRQEILDLLLPVVSDCGVTMELSSLAALSLGLVYAGSCNGDITSTILQTLMEREEEELKDPFAKLMGAGLALLFLGKQDAAEAPLETLKAIENPLAKQIEVMVEIVAYAASGNVLKVQKMLHICNDHIDPEKESDVHQGFAVIGIAMIAMGEDIGSEMAIRSFNHLVYMHYGEPVIRRSVPLALGLLCASNPLVHILDLLSKYSHDNDQEVSINAIFAMGLVGAGTNNARLAQMLRQLAAYYHKEVNHLFMVRIAQGLVHMGKGLLTINPFNSNRQLYSLPSVAGLFITLLAILDSKTFIFGKSHYFLYYLVLSMYPRFLMTLDSELKPISVTCRVGQAVDVVGQAGRPKTITGFQTHLSPVLLGYTERAELASDEYKSLVNVLEGFVILEKNPECMDETK